MRHADLTMGLNERGRLGHARVRPARYDETGFGRLPVVLRTIQGWLERRRQRRALDQLDGRMLKDIGLTRIDVQREIEKPFWQT